MTGTKLNKILGGVIALANAVIPFLVLVGVVDWTGEQVAGAMAVVVAATTLVGYIFAQSPATNTPDA